jgi:hypothetical protein
MLHERWGHAVDKPERVGGLDDADSLVAIPQKELRCMVERYSMLLLSWQ